LATPFCAEALRLAVDCWLIIPFVVYTSFFHKIQCKSNFGEKGLTAISSGKITRFILPVPLKGNPVLLNKTGCVHLLFARKSKCTWTKVQQSKSFGMGYFL
jgi:predicted YcjX-like family ATPase